MVGGPSVTVKKGGGLSRFQPPKTSRLRQIARTDGQIAAEVYFKAGSMGTMAAAALAFF